MYILGDIGNSETKVFLVNSKKKIIRNMSFPSKKIDNVILNKKFKIKCPQAFNIDVKKFISKKQKKLNKDEIIWFTIVSKFKSIICKHVHISKFGHVGADHSF